MEGPLVEQLRERHGVIVDLTDLSFIDSSGIGILIQTSRAFADGSQMHVVIGRGSQVERVFSIARIGQALPVFFDREQAEAALDGSPDGRPDTGA